MKTLLFHPEHPMSLAYVKRYRMLCRLGGARRLPGLPVGYKLAAWSRERLSEHVEVKHLSFQDELDSRLFESLSSIEGCERLMTEISERENFVPQATWLVEYFAGPHKVEPCGTVQGMRLGPQTGGIQNVGVTPLHRGRGLGTALVEAALAGFQQAGMRKVYLDVTAENQGAIRLYQRMGFRRVKTQYRAVEVAYSLG